MGKGGKPRIRPNPYTKIDMLNLEEPIVLQGELQKYKPGFTATFIDRWVCVTETALRYYTSKPVNANAASKPIMAIPLIAIQSIQ